MVKLSCCCMLLTLLVIVIGEIIIGIVSLIIGIAIDRVVIDHRYVIGGGIWSGVLILITCGIELFIMRRSGEASIICALGCHFFVAFIAVIEVLVSSVYAAHLRVCSDCKSSQAGSSLYICLSLIMSFQFVLACCCGYCCCGEKSEHITTRRGLPSQGIAAANGHSLQNNILQPSDPILDTTNDTMQFDLSDFSHPSVPIMGDSNDYLQFVTGRPSSEDCQITNEDALPAYHELEPPPSYDELYAIQDRQ